MAGVNISDFAAATAIDTACENASTTPTTANPSQLCQSHQHDELARNLVDYQNRLPTFLFADCACLCTSSTADSPSYQLSLSSKAKRKRCFSDIDNATLDFRHSYSTTLCNCTKCPRQDFNFLHIASFSSFNISSSTAFDYTNTTTSNEEPTTPPQEYTASSRALGILTEKRSPLFGLGRGVSLRTQAPFYSDYLSNNVEYISPKSLRLYKENIDFTATEALLSMNDGKKSVNASETTSKAAANGLTDINRNHSNGIQKNWAIMTTTTAEKREHLYKILVIGELGTGKTSFIKRYVHQFFSQNYRATIGVDFALKVLHWDSNTIVRLQLWDIAGQERFGNMTRVYYKEAVGAFIVFDVTRSGTFDCVSKWKEDLDSKVQLPDGSPIPCILLANKCDQDKQGVVSMSEKMDEYVKEHGFAGWFETSAKENINIDEAARALVNKILLNDKLISASDLADSERFNLDHSADQTLNDGKNKCSC